MAVMGRVAMLAMLVVLGLQSAMAATYTVGGSGGWALQNSNSVYDGQFANINLVVGDKLSFPYTAPQHNVYEIPPADLAACNFGNAIATYVTSNPVITLTTAGVHAFACQVPTHCSQFGMQLQVTVGAGAPVPAPVSPPTPAPVTPAPTAPVPAPVTAPVPSPVEAPAPAPVKPAPGPAPKAPVPAPKPSPPKGTPTIAAPIQAPAPAPAGSGASFVTAGPAMVVCALFAGFSVLLL